MPTRPDNPREIAVPVSIFPALRDALAEEVGVLPAIHALHNAGFSAGVEAAGALRAFPDESVLDLPEDAFWARVSSHFSRRGWGTLSHEALHEAVGVLRSTDWAEATTNGGEDASCSFSTGFLAGLLSTLAGGDVAVLEVECRARGDAGCTFAFGNAAAIHEVYGKLLDGVDLHTTVADL